MIRSAFAYLVNVYSFFIAASVVSVAFLVVSTVWMATTHSVAPELLQQLGPVSRASQDPRVEPRIPLNTAIIDAFREIEVPGWEYEFGSEAYEERLTHTLGILSLHNGGTYRIEPLTAPVEFVSALEAAAANGVTGVEQFLVDAGNGATWHESDYDEYETVVLNLVPDGTEEFLLKAFVFGGFLTPSTLAITAIAFRRMRQRPNTQVANLEPSGVSSR